MRYTKAVDLWDDTIRHALEQGNLKLQSGQWVRLGRDNPRLSRFHEIKPNGHIIAFHYPRHVTQYESYVKGGA
jgi:hypothetical protein